MMYFLFSPSFQARQLKLFQSTSNPLNTPPPTQPLTYKHLHLNPYTHHNSHKHTQHPQTKLSTPSYNLFCLLDISSNS